MTHFTVARAAALAAGLMLGAATASALECPQPRPHNGRSVIKETPSEIAELAPVLTGADVSAQVPAIVDGLRKRYPNAHSAELLNYLITAYCPSVAKAADLSEAERTARVRAFSKAVFAALY